LIFATSNISGEAFEDSRGPSSQSNAGNNGYPETQVALKAMMGGTEGWCCWLVTGHTSASRRALSMSWGPRTHRRGAR
jgi:hypothetical protein